MFACVVDGYPIPIEAAGAEVSVAARVAAILAEQERAGLELLTDGGVRWSDPWAPFAAGLDGIAPGRPIRAPGGIGTVTRLRVVGEPVWRGPILVDAWRATASAASPALVKQVVPGPYTLGRSLDRAGRAGRSHRSRRTLTLALARALNAELLALADAGCRVLQVQEDGATRAADAPERALFAEAHQLLTDGLGAPGLHLSLAICGGNADGLGVGPLVAAPYHSYLLDLVAGPENWRLIAALPHERGTILGVADARTPAPDDVELVIWAAGYAASTMGRGRDRVGVAPSGSLADMPPAAARAKIEMLGRAVHLVSGSAALEEVAGSLDPRALGMRSAALGRITERPRRRPSPGAGSGTTQPRT